MPKSLWSFKQPISGIKKACRLINAGASSYEINSNCFLFSATTDSLGQSTSTEYDSSNRPNKVTDRKGHVTQITYNERSQVSAITRPDRTISFQYDTADRLSQIKYIKAQGTSNEQLIGQIDYSYDAKGQRTAKTTLNNNCTGTSETPMQATFDTANRMTGISLSIAGATKTYTLSYDSNGNLTQKQNTAIPTDQTTYAWDASNRLSRQGRSQSPAQTPGRPY